jgi:signal transduction histidine kinase
MAGEIRTTLGPTRSLPLKVEPEIPPIQADPGGFKENLLRVVGESCHGMPDGGAVEISTSKGIRANVRDRVFDPYTSARSRDRKAGLGLTVVYRFVALAGGRIDGQNAPGMGAAYLLRFPLAYGYRLGSGFGNGYSGN